VHERATCGRCATITRGGLDLCRSFTRVDLRIRAAATATATGTRGRRGERGPAIAKEVARGERVGALAARRDRVGGIEESGRRTARLGAGREGRGGKGRAERARRRVGRSRSRSARSGGGGSARREYLFSYHGVRVSQTAERGVWTSGPQSWSVRRPADSRYRRAADFARDTDP